MTLIISLDSKVNFNFTFQNFLCLAMDSHLCKLGEGSKRMVKIRVIFGDKIASFKNMSTTSRLFYIFKDFSEKNNIPLDHLRFYRNGIDLGNGDLTIGEVGFDNGETITAITVNPDQTEQNPDKTRFCYVSTSNNNVDVPEFQMYGHSKLSVFYSHCAEYLELEEKTIILRYNGVELLYTDTPDSLSFPDHVHLDISTRGKKKFVHRQSARRLTHVNLEPAQLCLQSRDTEETENSESSAPLPYSLSTNQQSFDFDTLNDYVTHSSDNDDALQQQNELNHHSIPVRRQPQLDLVTVESTTSGSSGTTTTCLSFADTPPPQILGRANVQESNEINDHQDSSHVSFQIDSHHSPERVYVSSESNNQNQASQLISSNSVIVSQVQQKISSEHDQVAVEALNNNNDKSQLSDSNQTPAFEILGKANVTHKNTEEYESESLRPQTTDSESYFTYEPVNKKPVFVDPSALADESQQIDEAEQPETKGSYLTSSSDNELIDILNSSPVQNMISEDYPQISTLESEVVHPRVQFDDSVIKQAPVSEPTAIIQTQDVSNETQTQSQISTQMIAQIVQSESQIRPNTINVPIESNDFRAVFRVNPSSKCRRLFTHFLRKIKATERDYVFLLKDEKIDEDMSILSLNLQSNDIIRAEKIVKLVTFFIVDPNGIESDWELFSNQKMEDCFSSFCRSFNVSHDSMRFIYKEKVIDWKSRADEVLNEQDQRIFAFWTNKTKYSIYVRNIPPEATTEDINNFFKNCQLNSLELFTEVNKKTKLAHIVLENEQSLRAINNNLQVKQLNGHKLYIS